MNTRKAITMNLLHAALTADVVQVADDFCRPDYRLGHLDHLVADDVALEFTLGEREIVLTVGDLQQAQALDDGWYWVPHLGPLRFYQEAQLH